MRAKPDRAPVGRRTVRARAVTPSHAIRGVAAFIIVLGLLIAPPPDLSDNFSREFASLAPSRVAPLSFISAAQAQTDTLANSPSDPVRAYHNALDRFKSILRERRAQIDSNRQLPNLPGQALYVARNEMISTYKDLTDALPSKIGRPNGLGIPPPYFDADNEPLLDEYRSLFDLMQAPHANAQKSDTPFRDVFDLGRAIGRARGLDAASAEVAGRISLGIFGIPAPLAEHSGFGLSSRRCSSGRVPGGCGKKDPRCRTLKLNERATPVEDVGKARYR